MVLTLAQPAFAAGGPPPADPLSARIITANGTGCAPEKVGLEVLSDNTGFRLVYREFRAQLGGGAKPQDFRKNCRVVVAIQAPPGYTYAINQAQHRGALNVANGAKGLQWATEYLSGLPSGFPPASQFNGPIAGDWEAIEDYLITQWAPCGLEHHRNFDSDVRALKGTSDPKTTTSSLELTSSFYRLNWTPCRPA
jgi:hypothetical protein